MNKTKSIHSEHKNYREKALSELSENIVSLKKELFNLRFQKALGDLKNVSKFSIIRKNIARIYTEISRRKSFGE